MKMTRLEHAAEAERIVSDCATRINRDSDLGELHGDNIAMIHACAVMAQVHATLATITADVDFEGPYEEAARELPASEPMQRLRAAELAAAWSTAKRMENQRNEARQQRSTLNREMNKAQKQRDEARAGLDMMTIRRDGLRAEVELLRVERDNAIGYRDEALDLRRAMQGERDAARSQRNESDRRVAGLIQRAEEAEEQRDLALLELERLREEAAQRDAVRDLDRQVQASTAESLRLANEELARLRAAVPDLPDVDKAELFRQGWEAGQQDAIKRQPKLPDVGPVTRIPGGDLCVQDEVFARHHDANRYREFGQQHLHEAAQRFAVAAFLDREAQERAADTTTDDDEVEEMARRLHAADDEGSWSEEPGWSQEVYRRQARAVIAPRARTNGEG